MKNFHIIFSMIIVMMMTNISFSGPNFKIKVLPLEVKKTAAKSYSLSFSVKYKNLYKEYFEDSTVPIPVEKFIIEGELQNFIIKERDFIFAGIDIDLNGDKDFDDSYSLKYRYNNYYLDTYKIKISSTGKKYKNYYIYKYFDDKNWSSTNKIGEMGVSFIVSGINYYSKKMIISTNNGESPLEVQAFPNPNVQVILIKPVESLNKKIDFAIGNDKNYNCFSNEKIIPGNDDLWNGVAWVVKDLKISEAKKEQYKLNLNNIQPPFALFVVPNLSFEKGVRIKMDPGVYIAK
jgi:hypothetical protein